MLGIGAIEIEEASYSLGMCGHIVVRINESNIRYKVTHSMQDGWQVSCQRPKDGAWSSAKRMSSEQFIELLPKDRGWNHNTFIAVWAGFAAGYEKGREEGKFFERERAEAIRVRESTSA